MKKILVICRNVSTYHAPIFKELAKKSDLNVLYLEKDGFKNKFNKEYNTWIKAEKFLFKGYNFTFLNHNKSYFRYIIFFFILLDILKKKKIENVLIFGYDSIYNWIALFISKISKKNILWRGEAINKKKTFKFFFKKIALSLFFKMCNKVFYSCKKNKIFLQNFTKKKLIPYPCSVDNLYFRQKYKSLKRYKEKIIKKFQLKKNSFKIISVSRLTERKNISELLNQVYLSKLKNIEILIVGDGPEKKKLIELSKKFKINCKFLGFLYHDKIPQLLSVSNLYCLLSKFDASPKSINEAMNFKLPIIINQTIGTADDLIKNNFNGIVLKKNSDFSKKLKKIIKDKKKLNYMSKNSYHMLDKFFSHKICVNNVLKYSK